MSIEAMKLALEALEFIPESGSMLGAHAEAKRLEAITAIKEVLAQPDDLTIAYMSGLYDGKNKYAPQRKWVGLTEEERESFWKADQMTQKEWDELFTAIEAKLREKNT